MSLPSSPTCAAAPGGAGAVHWSAPARQAAFEAWLAPLAAAQGLLPASLRPASSDASFRRYLRLDARDGSSRIVMDAPPGQEDCRPFVRVQALMQAAGLRVPQIQAWNEAHGFMLLSDLGAQTVIERLDARDPQAAHAWYLRAVDLLIGWQRASRAGVLPVYDEPLLRRELQLFPDWYAARHHAVTLTDAQQATLARAFDAIVAHNLAAPSVFVHRDFMMRNLMAPTLPAARGSLPPGGALAALGRPGGGSDLMAPTLPAARGPLPPGGALAALGRPGEGTLGVLDFQDAVYGPVTYDIASLMRDAFISWEEDFVIDITVRYWEKARRLGLLGAASGSGWGADFGEFYRAVDWMALQRHLKVAGIFARLTLRDGKPRYLADAPRFIGYIRQTAGRYRELAPLLRLIDEIEGTQAALGYAFGRI